jgi:hypothetical protein
MGRFRKILNDEMKGYHTQLNKMKNNDTSILVKMRRKKNV